MAWSYRAAPPWWALGERGWLQGLAALTLAVALLLLLFVPAPLHEDEAIYSAWAARLPADPLLSQTPVDKPPVAFYPLALSLALWGPTPVAARLPNVGWTVLAVGAVVVALRATRPRAAIAGAFLFLAAPLTLSHAASVFLDLPMVALFLAGVAAARWGRPGWAGAAMALAVMTKPTALLLLPWGVAESAAGAGGRRWAWPLVRGALLVLGAGWGWESARYAPSWWLLGQRAYGTLGHPGGLDLDWLWWALLGVGPLVGGALVAGGGWQRARGRLAPAALWGTVVGWVPLHIVLGFQPWERYLLPLAALLALGGAAHLRRPARAASLAVLCALPLLGWTVAGESGLGGRDGRWDGIQALGATIQALPAESTIITTSLHRPLAFYAPSQTAIWVPDAEAARRWKATPRGQTWFAGRPSEVPSPCRPAEARPFVLVRLTDLCWSAHSAPTTP